MLDVSAIPEAWTRALSELRSVAPYAVLAGGSLRDLALGGEVKDLDFFVPVDATPDYITTKFQMCELHDWRPRGTFLVHGYRTGMAEEVMSVQTFEVPGIGLPVQVIYLNLPALQFRDRVLRRMDFDACRIGYDGNTLKINNEALFALQDRHFTLLRADNWTQAARSLARAERFAERYPDVTIDTSLAQQFVEVVSFPEALGL